ncbi:MAG: glycosylasparaginase [bacterium]|nr:glycosylasparaginase [bacterium]
MDRRRFIQNAASGAGAAALAARSSFSKEGTIAMNSSNPSPMMMATWNFGVAALEAGHEALKQGKTALDAVERAAIVTENDPENTSVGYGGYPNARGVVQLDAAIIDGKTGRMGSVGAIENIKNPISVARKVLEHSPHVMIVGEGAKSFALSQGFHEENLLTPKALDWYAEQLKKDQGDKGHDTIGVLARDGAGDMAVACTTSGLAMKWPGRVGDSPLIGAGLYMDGEVGGATGTGVGERAIETCAAFAIVEMMRNGKTPQEACEALIRRVARRNSGKLAFQFAFMAMNVDGEYGAASYQSGFEYALLKDGKITLNTGKTFGKDFD